MTSPTFLTAAPYARETAAPPSAHAARTSISAPAAIVIGLDCATGLQSARILAGRGIPVIGIAGDPRHPCCRTRVCERILSADTADIALIELLERLGPELAERAVLFPCTDMSVLLISRHREKLEPWYHVVLPDRDVVEMLIDKGQFYTYAQREGLPLPQTFFLRSRTDAEIAASRLHFPCILKPALKTRRWKIHSRAKAYRVADAPELLRLYERCSEWTEELVVQEWIQGEDTDHYTCNCYFNADSEPLVTMTTRKLRQWPPTGGEGSLSEEVRNEPVRQETIRLFKNARHQGLGYLEMKRDSRTGEHLIIEPNIGRPTGRSATAEAAGVELLHTMYCDAVGRPLPPNREQLFRGVKWIHFRRDFQSALYHWWRGELSLWDWFASWRGAKNGCSVFVERSRSLLGGHGPNRSGRALQAKDTRKAGGRVTEAASPTSDLLDVYDYDLHGLAGIRLIDASRHEVARVSAQLGPIAAPLSREPDIVIRFVERLPLSTPPGLLGVDDAGFTDDAFLVLRGKHKTPVRVEIPFEAIGGKCEIVCERGLAAVPLLIPILNLTVLANGALPLHAAAFRYRGSGVLATGWSKGGKTETLLGFASHGAEYIGDEWVYLSGDGDQMYGIPEPVRVWDWHLEELPEYRRRLGRGARARLRILRSLSDGLERFSGNGRGPTSKWQRDTRRLAHLIKNQRHVDLSPQRVFGSSADTMEGEPTKVLFVASHESEHIRVEPIDPGEVARRMAFSLQEERSELLSFYRKFRFAFPDRSNPLMELVNEVERERLETVLEGKECYAVHHPYPVSIPALVEALDPLLAA